MFVDAILSKKQNGQPNVVLKKNGDYKTALTTGNTLSKIS